MGLFDRLPGRGQGEGLKGAGGDALSVVIDYVKQETVEPVKGLGRFLVFGVAGSLLLSTGAVLLLVAVLRVLQTQTGSALTGNLSWVPYGCVALLGVAVAAMALWRVAAGPARRRQGGPT